MIRALQMLPPQVEVEAVSSLYESPPQPPAPPPSYYNAAARVTTALEPETLLRHLKRIERRIGREDRERWAPRPIDLDIALYDDLVLDTNNLTIPRPRIAQHAVFLQPLLNLDADLAHPMTGERLDGLVRALGDYDLPPIKGPTWAN